MTTDLSEADRVRRQELVFPTCMVELSVKLQNAKKNHDCNGHCKLLSKAMRCQPNGTLALELNRPLSENTPCLSDDIDGCKVMGENVLETRREAGR